MFKLMRPCNNCPFKKGTPLILNGDRVIEIVNSTAFQCHKTVDYDNFDDDRLRQGQHPQQCAGLMAMLVRDPVFVPNQIMQIAERLGYLDTVKLDPDREAFDSVKECVLYHDNNSGVRT